jgi:uncharacterized protein with HEPN domain
MQLKASKLLEDVRAAADLIVRFTEGKSPADYAGDPLLRSGVERQFLIIGEAMSQLARLAPEVAAQITHSRRIIAFCNVLVHGYDLVDHDCGLGRDRDAPPRVAPAGCLASRRALIHPCEATTWTLSPCWEFSCRGCSS